MNINHYRALINDFLINRRMSGFTDLAVEEKIEDHVQAHFAHAIATQRTDMIESSIIQYSIYIKYKGKAVWDKGMVCKIPNAKIGERKGNEIIKVLPMDKLNDFWKMFIIDLLHGAFNYYIGKAQEPNQGPTQFNYIVG